MKSINIVHADTVRQLEVKMDDNTFLTNNDILSDRNLLNDIQALKPNIGLSYRHSELRNIAMKKISRRKVKVLTSYIDQVCRDRLSLRFIYHKSLSQKNY